MKRRRSEATCTESGFTLVELLIVLVIIALVAAIALPILSHAREKARLATCASNLHQIGIAAAQYEQDYDETMFLSESITPRNPITWSYAEGGASPPFTIQPGRGLLAPYIKNAGVWRCPSATVAEMVLTSQPVSMQCPPYGLNVAFASGFFAMRRPVSIAQIQVPAETILVADSAIYFKGQFGWSEYLYPPWPTVTVWPPSMNGGNNVHGRHNGMANVLWCDGHVEAEKPVAVNYAPDARFPSLAQLQSFNIGSIMKGPYTGNPQIDDYYYELKKP